MPWAVAVDTTGSSSCWVDDRRPGIGFGLGLDRVVLALAAAGVPARPDPAHVSTVVVGADPADTLTRLRIATQLRAAGLSARAELGHRKLGKQLESAGRDGAHFAVICGDELAAGQVLLRDLQAGTQRPVTLAELDAGAGPERGAASSRGRGPVSAAGRAGTRWRPTWSWTSIRWDRFVAASAQPSHLQATRLGGHQAQQRLDGVAGRRGWAGRCRWPARCS